LFGLDRIFSWEGGLNGLWLRLVLCPSVRLRPAPGRWGSQTENSTFVSYLHAPPPPLARIIFIHAYPLKGQAGRMAELAIPTPSAQVAAHLRGELLRGRWSGTMPGVPALGKRVGVPFLTIINRQSIRCAGLTRELDVADHVARGRKDLRQNHTQAEFVDGGPVGPGAKSSFWQRPPRA